MPMKTEITPLLIITKLEEFDYPGATAIAVVMLVASFVLLLAINFLQCGATAITRRLDLWFPHPPFPRHAGLLPAA